mgnify:CR=1
METENKLKKPMKNFLVAAIIIVCSFFLMVYVFPENETMLPILSFVIFASLISILLLIIDWTKSKGRL